MCLTVCLTPAGTFDYPRGGGRLWAYLNWALGFVLLDCRVIWPGCIYPAAKVEDDGDRAWPLGGRPSGLALEGWGEGFPRSKGSIESSLARPVDSLSYPFGDAGEDPAAVASVLSRAGYCAAFHYGGAAGPMPPDDPFRVPRVAMGRDTDLSAALAASGRFTRLQSHSNPQGRS